VSTPTYIYIHTLHLNPINLTRSAAIAPAFPWRIDIMIIYKKQVTHGRPALPKPRQRRYTSVLVVATVIFIGARNLGHHDMISTSSIHQLRERKNSKSG
jgi:hypothetical protein